MRVSALGEDGSPGTFSKYPEVQAGGQALVGLRLSNPGPNPLVHVTAHVAMSGGAGTPADNVLGLTACVTAPNANPPVTTATAGARSADGSTFCPEVVPGSTYVEDYAGGGRQRIEGDITRAPGVDVGTVEVPLERVRAVYFRVLLKAATGTCT